MVQRFLDDVAFRERTRAEDNLRRLLAHLPETTGHRVRHLLSGSPDADTALDYLERLQARHPEWFPRLARSAAFLRAAVAVFSYSRFLAEEVLQHPEWLEEMSSLAGLNHVLSVEHLVGALERFLEQHVPDAQGPPPALWLATFRRRQILRIFLRDVLVPGTLAEDTEELSNLADAILEVTYRRLRAELVRRYGVPRWTDSAGCTRDCGFVVVALGKLGGQELNYSSDIDLMFLYSGNGQTDGPVRISNKEFFVKLSTQYTDLLSTHSAEGRCYRIDLRLRPDGSLGEVCTSLDGAKRYYQTRARDWELQMLIKARPAAGDTALGREFVEFVEPLIYSSTLDFSAVEAVSEARERIQEKLAARRARPGFDVKLAPGGIRDIEFLVQCLQRLHGGREPWVRHAGTLEALRRLHDKKLLDAAEYSRLFSAYQFLRTLEHRLQLVEDLQTHTLPSQPAELDVLAQRMPASDLGASPSREALMETLQRHLASVRGIYERVIHAQHPDYYGLGRTAEATGGADGTENVQPGTNLLRFLDLRAPQLALSLSRHPLRRHHKLFEHFLERIVSQPDLRDALDSDAALAAHTLDLFDHSQFFAEQLVRHPDSVLELRYLENAEREGLAGYAALAEATEDAGGLRRLYRRQMLRLQGESVCLGRPVFTTLARTSALADAVIGATYRMALESVLRTSPPPGYEPRDQMMVIALGRLGLKEFDLASDADLVFIVPDADARQLVFWTRVAERMIDALGAYTIDGTIFSVDTRLRPNGREGALVQSEGAVKEYFEHRAEAWEGIAYMKSRAVAGDIQRGTRFLEELQQLDWRRYGQSGRSQKQLRAMRKRLEREQGESNPLKAAAGGYFDIDFALMYLRLKGAGIFFPHLNTPARIDIVERMGHLDRADAEFLRDAATFYRALDHAQRVYSGHSEGSLPHAQARLEVLQELMARWTVDHLHDQPLVDEVEQIRVRTREFFDRVFASA